MGTRFVLDAYVLDQLIYPNVGTAADPRGLPSGLDTAAVLGSSLASRLMDASGAPAYAHCTQRRDALSAAVANRPTAQWGATVYDTELKHDTILYAKQAMAEAGGDEPRTLTNWVEPDPATFERVAAAADLMRRGLDQRGLLAGGTVSPADNERLRDTGSQIEQLVWLTSGVAADAMPASDQDAALIADVATGQDR